MKNLFSNPMVLIGGAAAIVVLVLILRNRSSTSTATGSVPVGAVSYSGGIGSLIGVGGSAQPISTPTPITSPVGTNAQGIPGSYVYSYGNGNPSYDVSVGFIPSGQPTHQGGVSFGSISGFHDPITSAV